MNFENAYVRWKALDVLGYLIQACEHGEIGEISRLNIEYNEALRELYGVRYNRQDPTELEFARDYAIGYFHLMAEDVSEDERNIAVKSLTDAKSFYMKELLRDDRFLYECFGGV